MERKKKIQTTVKQFKKLVAAGKLDEAKKQLPGVYKTLDKMTKVGFIKRGTADRLKSRLSKKLAIKNSI